MIIHDSQYQILEISDLPEDIQDELSERCTGNDSGKIINPDYYPLLRKWLVDNGHKTTCYIGWWSW